MTSRLNRRTVLKAAGTAIALPLLQAMRPRHVVAGVRKSALPVMPHRIAFFYAPNGMHMPDWLPSATGADFVLPPTLKPLEPFRAQLNVLGGLTLDGARAHGDGPGDHARAVAAF
jgi:hypothetical protein